MAEAIRTAASIDPIECLRVAEQRFPVRRMTGEYLSLYRRLAAPGRVAVASVSRVADLPAELA